MFARTETAEQRLAIYRGLRLRNRLVAILRIGVPALGAIVLGAIVIQMAVAALEREFGFSNIRIEHDAVTVDSPRYAGAFGDGSTYFVTAQSARAGLDAFNRISLSGVTVSLTRGNGDKMGAEAAEASIETHDQLIVIPGDANVADSRGTKGVLTGAEIDWPHQTLKTKGPVHFVNGAGATIDAQGLDYDARTRTWTFHRATVTLPQTPGDTP